MDGGVVEEREEGADEGEEVDEIVRGIEDEREEGDDEIGEEDGMELTVEVGLEAEGDCDGDAEMAAVGELDSAKVAAAGLGRINPVVAEVTVAFSTII